MQRRPNKYEFVRMARVYWTPNFGTKDISFGIHICWAGRIDIHFMFGMLSIGRVPIYRWTGQPEFASSNTFHDKMQRLGARGFCSAKIYPVRASVHPH